MVSQLRPQPCVSFHSFLCGPMKTGESLRILLWYIPPLLRLTIVTIRAAACHSLYSLSHNIIHMHPFLPLFFTLFHTAMWCCCYSYDQHPLVDAFDVCGQDGGGLSEGIRKRERMWLQVRDVPLFSVTLTDSLVDWLTVRVTLPIDWFVGWLSALLISSLTGWPSNWLLYHLPTVLLLQW